MPLIKIETNQIVSEPALQGLLEKTSAFVADLFGKTEQYVMATVEPGKSMMFGATTGPAAQATIKKIGLDADKCPEYAKAVCEFLEKELGVPPERVFASFEEVNPRQLGWNGKTFG